MQNISSLHSGIQLCKLSKHLNDPVKNVQQGKYNRRLKFKYWISTNWPFLDRNLRYRYTEYSTGHGSYSFICLRCPSLVADMICDSRLRARISNQSLISTEGFPVYPYVGGLFKTQFFACTLSLHFELVNSVTETYIFEKQHSINPSLPPPSRHPRGGTRDFK